MAAPLPVGRVDAALLARPEWVAPKLETQDFRTLDPKRQLVHFCQKKLGRIFNQGDISYTTNKFPTGFQSIVKLACLSGQEFAGELQPSAEQAEQAAARIAMDSYQVEVSQLGLDSVQVKKRKGGPGGDPSAKKQRLESGVMGLPGLVPPSAATVVATSKMELNTHCSKIVRRVMEKTDVIYETEDVEGGFQSILRLNCLPGAWANRVFVGEVQLKKAEAEQSVAGVALAAIRNDTTLMGKFSAPSKPKQRPPLMKGKGKGKATMQNMQAANMLQQMQGSSFSLPMQVLSGMGIPNTGFW